jgi:hypothetical protein
MAPFPFMPFFICNAGFILLRSGPLLVTRAPFAAMVTTLTHRVTKIPANVR